MEPVTIGFLIACLGLVAMSVWLFVARSKLIVEAGAVTAAMSRLEQDVATARGEVERVRADARAREAEITTKLDLLSAEKMKIGADRARLEAELEGQSRVHRAELSDVSASAEQSHRHLREMFEAELKSEKEGFEQRFASLKREAEARSASERETLEAERRVLKDEMTRLETRIRELNEQTRAAFSSAAQQALAHANTELVKMAEAKLGAQHAAATADMEKRQAAVEVMVKPIGESLKKTEEKLGEIERERAESFGKLSEQIRGVSESNNSLRDQTGKLVGALKRPEIRGRYGEIQLERLVELAGMTAYADFNTQHSTRDSGGNLLRPDLIVTMANQREIVVDAKTNISSYLDAIDAPDADKREECFQRFATHVEQQMQSLAKKQYWSQYKGSPDFVVMFIPGDQFLDAALRRRPTLIETAAETGVILATPSSLIGLLKTVALGWREKRLEDQAKELFTIGSELHDRAATAWEHLAKVGDGLNKTVESYNKAVRSVETRLMPTLRKFEDAGAKSAKELPEIPEVSVRPQQSAPVRPALTASAEPTLLDP